MKAETLGLDHEGKPFENCIDCNKTFHTDESYVVEKVVRLYPELNKEIVIVEYAMCQHCVQQKTQELSKESLQAMQSFLKENTRYPSYTNQGFQCLVTGTPITECVEYQIGGMVLGGLPDKRTLFMISGKVMEQMNELISNETRGFMDDFTNTHFGLPPELKNKPVMIF